ncbi:hypothetical protein K435DRAFT_792791 [Dendrothele bispora CBS 962.96]|uniref:Uncharacterized protein n=1 Tax=Dendrothele bispora (strain CBS 962.96) TaxID=1314807 RepID=A0A4S8MHG4_DENBC|nr:hypothetical protein K435DRAFT_792791 [Dendrothele bispora CBS 962.96]
MDNLYSALPSKSYTLEEFVRKASDLQNASDSRFHEFALTGDLATVVEDELFGSERVGHQVNMDVTSNRMPEDYELGAYRDYDSVLGFGQDILVKSSITVYPVPNLNRSLKTSIHVVCNIEDHELTGSIHALCNIEQVSNRVFMLLSNRADKILNLQIGRFGDRSEIYLFFPKLAAVEDPERDAPTRLNADQAREFYEVGVRPTISDLLYTELSDWPADYEAEISRATTSKGGIAYGSKLIAEDTVHAFSTTLRQKLLEGVHAERITKIGSTHYSRDTASHLTHVSGCRIVPGELAAGPNEVKFLQLYTSDKSQTYAPEGNMHGKFLTLKDAMGSEQPPKPLGRLQNTYTSCVRDTGSNARVEVRVPLDYATQAFLRWDTDALKNSILVFKRDIWWLCWSYRCFAIKEILYKQSIGSSLKRCTRESLLLTAGLVWMVNGIHSRPEDGPAARSLAKAILPVTDAGNANIDLRTLLFPASKTPDRTEGYTVPYVPNGMVFLRRLVLEDDVPRVCAGGPFINEKAFQYLFKMSLEDVQFKYDPAGEVPKEVIAKKRFITNKTQRTMAYHQEPGSPPVLPFNLTSRGLDPIHIEGEEVTDETLDQQVANLWNQFLFGVILKSPNPSKSTEPSYIKLNKRRRQRITEGDFKNKRLSQIFRACKYKISTTADFERIFHHLFPAPGPGFQIHPGVQNYRNCRYFDRWTKWATRGNLYAASIVHLELKNRAESLFWLPFAGANRMWDTGSKGKFTRLPKGSVGPAPKIICWGTPGWDDDDALSADEIDEDNDESDIEVDEVDLEDSDD